MRIGLICMMIFGFLTMGAAQDKLSSLEKDIENIKQNQKIILEELKAIKTILSRLPLPPPQIDVRGIEIDIAGKPVIGKSVTNLVMIEFTDYQCQFCGRYSRETFPEIKKEYVDSGRIDYVIIDFPLPSHPLATKAAEATHCAEDQGKFWDMHHQMMADQNSLSNLLTYANALNLDLAIYEECLSSNRHADKIADDIELAKKMGITGVPGFILASRDPERLSIVKGISVMRGAMPLASFQREIDQALKNLQE